MRFEGASVDNTRQVQTGQTAGEGRASNVAVQVTATVTAPVSSDAKESPVKKIVVAVHGVG